MKPVTLQLYWSTSKPMCCQWLHTSLPISLLPVYFLFSQQQVFCFSKQRNHWADFQESHHTMKQPPEPLMSQKHLSSVMTHSLPHLVLHSTRQTKHAYLDWNHRLVVVSSLSFEDVFFLPPFFTSGQLEKKPSISIFFNEPPISQVPGCSSSCFLRKVLCWSAHVKQSGDPSSCQHPAWE